MKASDRSRKNGKDTVKFYKVYCDRVLEPEKRIRHCRACDQMLFIMCKELIPDIDETARRSLNGEFKLKDISASNLNSILEKQITLPMMIDVKVKNKKVESRFKIKDYGKVRKFLKDIRLRKLLQYYKQDIIPKEKLEKELKDYEATRIKLFHHIYQFEEACGQNQKMKMYLDEDKNWSYSNDREKKWITHTGLLKEFAKQFNINENLKCLEKIRNKLMHNEYPDFQDVKDIIGEDDNFIKRIGEYAIGLYENFTKKLNGK